MYLCVYRCIENLYIQLHIACLKFLKCNTIFYIKDYVMASIDYNILSEIEYLTGKRFSKISGIIILIMYLKWRISLSYVIDSLK